MNKERTYDTLSSDRSWMDIADELTFGVAPSLDERIVEYLTLNPNSPMRDIMKSLKISLDDASTSLTRLRKQCKVYISRERTVRGNQGKPHLYALTPCKTSH